MNLLFLLDFPSTTTSSMYIKQFIWDKSWAQKEDKVKQFWHKKKRQHDWLAFTNSYLQSPSLIRKCFQVHQFIWMNRFKAFLNNARQWFGGEKKTNKKQMERITESPPRATIRGRPIYSIRNKNMIMLQMLGRW